MKRESFCKKKTYIYICTYIYNLYIYIAISPLESESFAYIYICKNFNGLNMTGVSHRKFTQVLMMGR